MVVLQLAKLKRIMIALKEWRVIQCATMQNRSALQFKKFTNNHFRIVLN